MRTYPHQHSSFNQFQGQSQSKKRAGTGLANFGSGSHSQSLGSTNFENYIKIKEKLQRQNNQLLKQRQNIMKKMQMEQGSYNNYESDNPSHYAILQKGFRQQNDQESDRNQPIRGQKNYEEYLQQNQAEQSSSSSSSSSSPSSSNNANEGSPYFQANKRSPGKKLKKSKRPNPNHKHSHKHHNSHKNISSNLSNLKSHLKQNPELVNDNIIAIIQQIERKTLMEIQALRADKVRLLKRIEDGQYVREQKDYHYDNNEKRKKNKQKRSKMIRQGQTNDLGLSSSYRTQKNTKVRGQSSKIPNTIYQQQQQQTPSPGPNNNYNSNSNYNYNNSNIKKVPKHKNSQQSQKIKSSAPNQNQPKNDGQNSQHNIHHRRVSSQKVSQQQSPHRQLQQIQGYQQPQQQHIYSNNYPHQEQLSPKSNQNENSSQSIVRRPSNLHQNVPQSQSVYYVDRQSYPQHQQQAQSLTQINVNRQDPPQSLPQLYSGSPHSNSRPIQMQTNSLPSNQNISAQMQSQIQRLKQQNFKMRNTLSKQTSHQNISVKAALRNQLKELEEKAFRYQQFLAKKMGGNGNQQKQLQSLLQQGASLAQQGKKLIKVKSNPQFRSTTEILNFSTNNYQNQHNNDNSIVHRVTKAPYEEQKQKQEIQPFQYQNHNQNQYPPQQYQYQGQSMSRRNVQHNTASYGSGYASGYNYAGGNNLAANQYQRLIQNMNRAVYS